MGQKEIKKAVQSTSLEDQWNAGMKSQGATPTTLPKIKNYEARKEAMMSLRKQQEETKKKKPWYKRIFE